MKTNVIVSIHVALILLAACGQQAPVLPTPTVTSTTIPTHTPTPTATLTPTITPTPTPIGVTEPMIAFVGKDSQGNLGIYVDGLYTGKPEKISPVTVAEESAPYIAIRWSPDGTKLMFANNNEINRPSLFLFDTATRQVQEITRVPSGLDVFTSSWSADGSLFYFGAASRSHPQAVYYKLDVSNRGMSQTNEFTYLNSNSHLNSLARCDGRFPTAVQALTIGGVGGSGPNGVVYDRICFYPELNGYGGLKYNEGSTEFVLITEEGEVQQTLVIFPANFLLNGSMDLDISSDKSNVLIVGEGGIPDESGSMTIGVGAQGSSQFAYAIPLSSASLDRSDPKLWDTWSGIQIFGWSPDSLNYLVAEFENRLEVIQAVSQTVVYEYAIHDEVTPLFTIRQSASGFDMVWPNSR